MSGARRVWLVVRREWIQRVRSTAFRVSTVISAAIVVAIIAIPQMYGGGTPPPRVVGVVGESSPQLQTVLRAAGRQVDLTVSTRAGVDLSTPAPAEAVVAQLDRRVTQLEKEIAQL